MNYCQGITHDGTPCTRNATQGEYCKTHQRAKPKSNTNKIPTNITVGSYSHFMLPAEADMLNEQIEVHGGLGKVKALLEIQINRVAHKLAQEEHAEVTNDEYLRQRLMRTKSIRQVDGGEGSFVETIRESPERIEHLVSLVTALNKTNQVLLQQAAQGKDKTLSTAEITEQLIKHFGMSTITDDEYDNLPITSNDPFGE